MSPERATAMLEMPARGGQGARCSECAARVCARVEQVPGVLRVECDAGGDLRVDYDVGLVTPASLRSVAHEFGAELECIYEHELWRVDGLDCPDCASTVAKTVRMLPGVVSAELNFASGTLLVEHEVGHDPAALVAAAIERTGHGATLLATPGAIPQAEVQVAGGKEAGGISWRGVWFRRRTEVAVLGSGGFIALGWAASAFGARLLGASLAGGVALALWLLAVAAGETLLWPRAVASVRARSIDMNVLMTIAVFGAVCIGQIAEAATVVFLFALGGWLEARALAKTRGSIRELMQFAPDVARVRRGGAVVEVSPGEVSVGEVLVVRPGERIPLDGTIRTGVSAIAEAAITGEPLPADKTVGDTVFAGSLNGAGLLEIDVTSPAGDSTLARIVRLTEEAQASRAPSQLLVDRFSRVYTPVAVVLAVLVATVVPLIGIAFGPSAIPFDSGWSVWIYRGLVVLVASCPCALVISTPVTFVSAIARAGREGILVKGGSYLELAASVRAVAFDKTGTLTCGHPEVVEAVGGGGRSSDDVLRIAATLEAGSAHPLASAVLAYARERGVAHGELAGITDLPGRGIEGEVDGRRHLLVSPAFADQIARVPATMAKRIADSEEAGRTVIVLVDDGEAVGLVSVSDPVRPGVPEVVREIHAAPGMAHTVLLTGDNERTGAAVAAHAGLTAHMARLLPAEKVDAILRLRERFGTVAMVGDGVNDAPALAAADIGIAMGAAGSDTALETADVALMGDDLGGLPRFFALGRRTLATVRQNVAFSVAVKVAVLVAAILGHATMWLAVFADSGVALLVIANGMRLLRGPRRSPVPAVAGD